MKKVMLIETMLLAVVALHAQDTIVFLNGNESVVKVTEVSNTELKYKMWSNQDGPTYTKPVSEVFMVKYKGGSREVYGSAQPVQASNASENRRSGGSDGEGYMEASRGELFLSGRKMAEEDLAKILNNDLYHSYRAGTKLRKAGHILNCVGWPIVGVGLFCDFIAWCMLLSGDYRDYYGPAITGYAFTGVGTSLLVPGYVLKGIGNGRLRGVANSYNSQNNLSLEISPTMMPMMNGGFGYGGGITLRF